MTSADWAMKQWTNIYEAADIIDGLLADFSACERERDTWQSEADTEWLRAEAAEARCKRLVDACQHVLAHGHLAPETERIVKEAMDE